MLLSMATPGETNHIKKINGKDTTHQFLASLGFVEGADVTIISELSGNIILNIKDTRVAIDKNMANRIII